MSNFIALIVEDDALQRDAMSDLLRNNGLEVVECSTAEAAEIVVVSTETELLALITDISLGGDMSGVQLAQYAKRKFPHLIVLMVSGSESPYFPYDIHFLLKSYKPRELLDAVLS